MRKEGWESGKRTGPPGKGMGHWLRCSLLGKERGPRTARSWGGTRGKSIGLAISTERGEWFFAGSVPEKRGSSVDIV